MNRQTPFPRDEDFYCMALSKVAQLGPIRSRKLMEHCGSATAVFIERKNLLRQVRGVGRRSLIELNKFESFDRVEREIEFAQRRGIRIVPIHSPDYPQRLKECIDAPLVLYQKGNFDPNHKRTVAIVGTRQMTEYGRHFIAGFVKDLYEMGVQVISGLALGVDIEAHRHALNHGIPTVGVVAHGLDRLYPREHHAEASRMLECGGLITEYMSRTNPDREHFPMRNRIIAGMSDAVVVVESAARGGAMITAMIANSYNRDVFAVPGRVGDPMSEGCNKLVMQNKAQILSTASELAETMGWDSVAEPVRQTRLFVELTARQESLVGALRDQNNQTMDQLCHSLDWSVSSLSNEALQLELEGILEMLPGRVVRLKEAY